MLLLPYIIMNIFVLAILPFVIMYLYSMIKTLFLDIVITTNTVKIKEKVVENNKQGESR